MALALGIMPHAASDHDLDELRARLDFLARCVSLLSSVAVHTVPLFSTQPS